MIHPCGLYYAQKHNSFYLLQWGGVLFKTLDKNQGSLNEGEIGTNDLENT